MFEEVDVWGVIVSSEFRVADATGDSCDAFSVSLGALAAPRALNVIGMLFWVRMGEFFVGIGAEGMIVASTLD